MSRESKITSAVIAVIVAIFVGLVIWSINSEKAQDGIEGDPTKLVRDTSHKTGSGPVQVVEYGDYQCPVCGKAEPEVQQMLKEYEGKITFYFRNFPLSQHENSSVAAVAAEAAAEQGKFWEMHDKLYATQSEWSNLSDPTDKFVSYAEAVGVPDIAKYRESLTAKNLQTLVSQDYADGLVHGVQGTPTFFVNGKTYAGEPTLDGLRPVINAALPAASASPSPSSTPSQ